MATIIVDAPVFTTSGSKLSAESLALHVAACCDCCVASSSSPFNCFDRSEDGSECECPSSADPAQVPSNLRNAADDDYDTRFYIGSASTVSADDAMVLQGKTIVVVRPSGTSRIPLYRRLRELGARVVMVSRTHRPAFEHAVDRWALCDPTEATTVEAAIDEAMALEAAEGHAGSPHAYISFDEYGVMTTAKICESRNFRPMPCSSAFVDTNNVKSVFRDWCNKNGVRVPGHFTIRSPTEDPIAALKASTVSLPVVVKPCPGAGSSFVRLCRTEAEFAEAAPQLWEGLRKMAAVDAYFDTLSTPMHLLVEEFIGGQEVDIDCVIEDGAIRFAGISDNFETVAPWFCEAGGISPSLLPRDAQESLMQLLRDYVDAARRHGERIHGVLHFEAKYDFERRNAYVIEVNCRIGGAETSTMVRNAFGVDLGEAAARLALNLPLQPLPEPFAFTGTYTASTNVYAKANGILKSMTIPEAGVNDDLIAAVKLDFAPGAKVGHAPYHFGCMMWLVASGATPEEAIANMKRHEAACEVDVEPFEQQ